MSFDIICSGCGAVSGPSVGLCPFCKTVMASSHKNNSPQETSISKLYESGKIDWALDLAKKMHTEKKESKSDISFLLLYSKILIDTEGPTSQIRALLSEAHLIDPTNQDVLDYIELLQAKMYLKKGINDPGELQLRSLLRRSPENIQAHFLLGSHLFWVDEHPRAAAVHLETCVKLSPNFLRAWGCLAAIYKMLGNAQLAIRAFQKCIELENDTKMREYFQEQIKTL